MRKGSPLVGWLMTLTRAIGDSRVSVLASRAAAAREARTETLESPIARVSVISQPTNGEPFLIAPFSPAPLEKRQPLFAPPYCLLGPAGVVRAAWALRLGY